MQALFGGSSEDDWRETIFRLCYHQHGGSGLSFNYESVMEMPLRDLRWYIERLDEQRSAEAAALKRAQGATT